MKKSNKQILILLIILAVILVSYFTYNYIKNKIDSKKEKKISYLILEDFNPENINGIYVEDDIGKSKFELERNENNWSFISPKNYRTDNSIIQSYLMGFQQLYYKDKFEIEANADLSQFGLANPQKRFVFYYNKEKTKKLEVLFGERVPSQDGLYLKVTDKPIIFIITLDAIQLIDFNAKQLRNKQIFSNINRDDIKLVKFINNETKDENIIEFENENFFWTASFNSKIKKILVPAESIKSIMDRIFYLSATDVVDELPKKYKVEYEIEITTKDGKITKCKIFKKDKSPDDQMELYYAINEQTNEIFYITLTTIKTFFTQKPYLLSELVKE